MTRYDLGDWEKGADELAALIRAGEWRHGIKTEDAAKVIVGGGKFPADLNTMLVEKWKKKSRDFLKFGLYYFTQSSLKNEYEFVFGKSGDRYRVRSFYCVPHGMTQAKTDQDGNPIEEDEGGAETETEGETEGKKKTEGETEGKKKPKRKRTKEGLWLRFLDLNPTDIRWLARRYKARAEDSGPVKKYIWTAQDRSAGLPDSITMADIIDDILDAL